MSDNLYPYNGISADEKLIVQDISGSTREDAVLYETAIRDQDFEGAQQILENNPKLQKCIINADVINTLSDRIYRTQQYSLSLKSQGTYSPPSTINYTNASVISPSIPQLTGSMYRIYSDTDADDNSVIYTNDYLCITDYVNTEDKTGRYVKQITNGLVYYDRDNNAAKTRKPLYCDSLFVLNDKNEYITIKDFVYGVTLEPTAIGLDPKYTANYINQAFAKLDGISGGANRVIVDTSLSTSSSNPISNSAVASAINSINNSLSGKASSSHTHNYLPLSGGQLTGGLHMRKGSAVYFSSSSNGYSDDAYMYLGGTYRLTSHAKNGFYWHNNTYAIAFGDEGSVDDFRPADYNGSTSSEKITLGTSRNKWKCVYAKTGSINTSDRNQKNTIKKISEKYEEMYKNLIPSTFLFNNGDRVHTGFIAQDVETAALSAGLSVMEVAAICKDQKYEEIREDGILKKKYIVDDDGNPVYNYGLRYEEFVALNTHMIQKLIKRVDELETELKELKGA
jgi:hypothetical protein